MCPGPLRALTDRVDITLASKGSSWDHVSVRALSGREAISQLFRFELEVVCDAGTSLPEEARPGGPITLLITGDHGETRAIHGILGPVRDNLDVEVERASYHLTVLPRAARLSLVETQEVHLNHNVPTIIQQKLARHGLGARDVELRLLDVYPQREIVVQYRESDVAFVSRLAEHAGVSFFFEHGEDHDVMVFTDHQAGFRPIEPSPALTFRPRGEARDLFALRVTHDWAPSTYVVHDYNYRKPLLDLSGFHTLASGAGGGVVDYGGHVKTGEEATALAKVRAEERAAKQCRYEGTSDVVAVEAGRRVVVTGHPKLERDEELLVTAVTHEAKLPLFGEEDGEARYRNTFDAVPAQGRYRPPRVTPKPRIHGVVTGTIQPGPDGVTGGYAKLDPEGRYTVEIHFDTAIPGEKKASHPIRMAQPFAGPNHNMHFPLRPGAEVLLAFADGDPDRPVIVGAVPSPAAPSSINAATVDRHRITTASGALIEIRDRR